MASEVRLRILRASLCHTDVLRWHGMQKLFPRVLGHEGVGVVESVGEGVTDIKVGDTVIPTFIGECGACPNCASGETNVCRAYPVNFSGLMPDGTSRMSARGHKLYHMFSCSTFSEYTVASINYVAKIDQRVPPTVASLLSCGFTTGFGAAWKAAKVEEGSTVAVLGLGGVGIAVVMGAKLMGASRIIGVDVNDKKKETGEAFGATDFVNPTEIGKPTHEVIRELTDGLGVDYSFECSGAATALNEAVESTKAGSGLTMVIGAGTQKVMPFNVESFLGGRTMKGCLFGGMKPRSDIHLIVDKCLNKEVQLDGFVTHEVELDDINDAFKLLKLPECLKVVIKI
ncbi:Alcohol dehydrogenase-like 3 [Acorus gramineus]|uniref:Alcohol dehydrogenase-like 3 n=1 Tax=Acorus gramineus TaxID=55184 RepID=A0AAV9AEL9_ACOGR|nr:Alcohol dehydrogenase-like 3 [Acorus gramineus]